MAAVLTFTPTRSRARRIVHGLLIAIALGFLALFLLLPLAAVFVEALRKGVGTYVAAIVHPEAIAAIELTLIVAAIGLDPTRTLVISQVVLSFGIPVALIPLVMFTAKHSLMGTLVNRRFTTIAASGVAAIIVALNVFLLYETLIG